MSEQDAAGLDWTTEGCSGAGGSVSPAAREGLTPCNSRTYIKKGSIRNNHPPGGSSVRRSPINVHCAESYRTRRTARALFKRISRSSPTELCSSQW